MSRPLNCGEKKRLAQSAALRTIIQQQQQLVSMYGMWLNESLGHGPKWSGGRIGSLILSEANISGSLTISWKARRIQSVSSDIA